MDPANEPFRVCAYWGPREDGAAQVLARTSEFLRALSAVHPQLAAWWSYADARPVVPDSPQLLAAIEASRFETPDGERLRAGGGFRLGMGSNEQLALNTAHQVPQHVPGLTLTITCNRQKDFPAGNNCLLRLPSPQDAPEGLYDLETVSAVVALLARTWQPDHALAASYPLRAAQSGGNVVVDVGWITYLGPCYAAGLTRQHLPNGIDAAELDDGILLRFPTAATSVTEDMVVGLRRHLVTAGTLPPVTPGDG